MSEIIYLKPFENNSTFSTFCFYNSLLPQLQEHYSKTKEAPILSFEKLIRIDPLVLPNLIGIGFFLSRFHDKPIELSLNYNPKLLYYLEKANFFKYTGTSNFYNQEGLKIFNFNDKFIGGFTNYIQKEQRKEHQLYYYIPDCYEIDNTKRHDYLIEELTLFTLKNQFGAVLLDTLPPEKLESTLESIAEPISNGILHSRSYSWAISQTRPLPFPKTVISLVDVGIGFKQSLMDKQVDTRILYSAKKLKLFSKSLEDFFYILESICFSILKDRHGLVDFILKICQTGTVRIHYNSTQILFTPRIIENSPNLRIIRQKVLKEFLELGNVKEETIQSVVNEVLCLSNLLLKLYSDERRYSPLRIYDINFKGVHIEFELG